MNTGILMQNVKVGEKFYFLNKRGVPRYKGKITYEMTRNNGKAMEYFRIDNGKGYTATSIRDNYVVVI
jgi:hypothetical protein